MIPLQAILERVNQAPGPVLLATLVRHSGSARIRLGSRILDSGLDAGEVLAKGGSALLRRALDPAWGLGPGADGVGEFLLERLVPRKQPPWINFCSLVLAKGKTCVLVTVAAVTGTPGYAPGDHFAYDERNHGLLPLEEALSLDLQRACVAVRAQGEPARITLAVPGGSLDLLLEPLAPVAPVPTVILAAGASRRLGQPKQLVALDGESLLRRIARTALAGAGPVSVVVGCGAEAMAAELAGLPVQIVVNEQWREGMASSIRAGVAALPAASNGVLLLLCDQPAVSTALLERLFAAHRADPDAVVACAYADIHGTPALLPARCFPELAALAGDRGARALVAGPGVVSVPFPDGALDVDRPEDLPTR